MRKVSLFLIFERFICTPRCLPAGRQGIEGAEGGGSPASLKQEHLRIPVLFVLPDGIEPSTPAL